MDDCKRIAVLGSCCFITLLGWGQNVSSPFCLQARQPFTIACDTTSEEKVVSTALQLLVRDFQAVLATTPEITSQQGAIWVGTVDKSPLLQKLIAEKLLSVTELSGKKEAFQLCVLQRKSQPILVIAGSDERGTAYGMTEVSRLMGVSPWEWWADATPTPLPTFRLEGDFRTMQAPSVEFRGIFINDEDWGLLPWSSKTYEPSDVKGQIGPNTHRRIFELLLRLRANTFWPAMHGCSRPFHFTPGNAEVADAYGIYLGTSHCEPMARNTNGEWTTDGQGEYDYVHNREAVVRFWEQRVAEVAKQDHIYTLGIRGVHDGPMQGAKTLEEQKTALAHVLKDQRSLLGALVQPDVTKVPQVFIPYKEVLDAYLAGLKVPQDVTLMWCDDNYGYIRHFPDAAERERKGGNGVYYHVSYWGRPHDYLWLGTTQPALIYQQMKLAYTSGIQKMWILNVGDIKPSEYQVELFLDMAWDLNKVSAQGVTTHLNRWLQREFGLNSGGQLLPLLQEHYRLAYIRKPEFMGGTRTEEKKPAYQVISDLPWSEQEIKERLSAYEVLSAKVEEQASQVPEIKQNAFFELVKYPIQAAAQMNKKLLVAQLARHQQAEWADSEMAYDSIVALTRYYNTLNDGKWNRMMDEKPRSLPVFQRVKQEQATQPLPSHPSPIRSFNGADYIQSEGSPSICEGLGYGGKAVAIPQGGSLSFQLGELPTDSIVIDLRLLPNHPVVGRKLRLSIVLDDQPARIIEYQTEGRSEEWKENVLRNQAIRRTVWAVPSKKTTLFTVKALDEGVVLDQLKVEGI